MPRRSSRRHADAPLIRVGQVLTTHRGGFEARVLSTNTYTVFGDGRRIGPMVITSHVKYRHTMATPLARLGEHFWLPGQQKTLFPDEDFA